MSDFTAGIGDAYWYEWMVGLLYALDMLDSNNQIKHVVFQENDLQGLDDVVVCYENGKSICIQVKHTRENDSLTFNDMIEKSSDDTKKSNKKKSYLEQFSSDWKRANDSGLYEECSAVLFTNRKLGKRKATLKRIEGQLPSLEYFWENYKTQIDRAESLKDISIKNEDDNAWSLWLDELKTLTDEEKLCFLKKFDIYANQEDLDELINKIKEKLGKQFGVNARLSIQLLQKLCYALIWWTTTLREKKEVTREDLYEALSLVSDNYVGEHDFAVCEPFFKSRIDFVEELEKKIIDGDKKVYFMAGEPGAGKTNIVSYMANKKDSIISARFHAFKPLDINDIYMSADEGISDPKALWGNLLISLRENANLKGKLSKYNVPISIELIDSIDKLRKETIRLAEILSQETGKKTVIAIDGLDHAARTGKNNTFLNTLLPPDSIPENVIFIIVGQPINQYKDYPLWIIEDDVEKVFVPKIDEKDILQLYESIDVNIPKGQKYYIVKLIESLVKGNALSVIYAFHEIKKCTTVDEAEKILIEKKLVHGVNAYYKYMWEAATKNLPMELEGIDKILAGSISMLNVGITIDMLKDISDDFNVNKLVWKSILSKLYPLIVCKGEKYAAFHNDFRLFLGKYLQSDADLFIEVSGNIADYVRYKCDDVVLKHEVLFNLLKNANRKNEYAEVFDDEYVCEALYLKRPMAEIEEQMEQVIDVFKERSVDLKYIVNLSSAVSSLQQFSQSLSWTEQVYEEKDNCNRILWSEKNAVDISYSNISSVLCDIEKLLACNKNQRAEMLYDKWLLQYSPEQLFLQLYGLDEKDDYDENKYNIIVKWGKIACKMNKVSLPNEDISEEGKKVQAYWFKGFIEALMENVTIEQINKVFETTSFYFSEDMHKYIEHMIVNGSFDCIKKICGYKESQLLSRTNKLFVMIWTLCNRQQGMCDEWIEEMLNEGFEYADEEKKTLQYILISFVLISKDYDCHYVYEECLTRIKEEREVEWSINNLLVTTIITANMCKHINNNEIDSVSINDYKANLENLFSTRGKEKLTTIGANEYEEFILRQVVVMTLFLKNDFRNFLNEFFNIQVKKNLRYIEVIWDYWKNNGETDKLVDIYRFWMNSNGPVWSMDLADMIFSADIFILKAKNLGWEEAVQEASSMKNSKLIGYSGHKEYSMGILKQWYERLTSKNMLNWKREGIKLLNISQFVSDTGDNRYKVFVDNAVAVSAGKKGVQALWDMANINKKWDKQWIQTIFDGVIAAMENGSFDKDELVTIWEYATKVFYINFEDSPYDYIVNINKIYIYQLKIAILKACERLGYDKVPCEMKNLAEKEFLYDLDENLKSMYKIPERWYEKEVVSDVEIPEYTELIRYVEMNFDNKYGSDIWRWIKELVCKMKHMGMDVRKYIPSIIQLIKVKRKECYSWNYDRVNDLISCIAIYISNDEYYALLDEIFACHYKNIQRYNDDNWYGLNSDLEDFTECYYATLPLEDNIKAFNKLLDMHMRWITGNGKVKVNMQYNNAEVAKISGWKQLSKDIYEKYLRDKND